MLIQGFWVNDFSHHATEPSPEGSLGGDGPRGRSQLEAPERANQWAHHVQLGMSASYLFILIIQQGIYRSHPFGRNSTKI